MVDCVLSGVLWVCKVCSASVDTEREEGREGEREGGREGGKREGGREEEGGREGGRKRHEGKGEV